MLMSRKPYPSDVSDCEWALLAPSLTLLPEERVRSARARFARCPTGRWRSLVKTKEPWRWMPNDLPPWEIVYQQAQRWLKAGCFQNLAEDLRVILRLAAGRGAQPTAVIIDSRTLRSTPESGARAPLMTAPNAKRDRSSTWPSTRLAIFWLCMSRPPTRMIAPKSAVSPRPFRRRPERT